MDRIGVTTLKARRKLANGRVQYRVLWEDNKETWEQRSDLIKDGLGDMIRALERARKAGESMEEAAASLDSESAERRGSVTPGGAPTPISTSRGSEKRSTTPKRSAAKSSASGRSRRRTVRESKEDEEDEEDSGDEEEMDQVIMEESERFLELEEGEEEDDGVSGLFGRVGSRAGAAAGPWWPAVYALCVGGVFGLSAGKVLGWEAVSDAPCWTKYAVASAGAVACVVWMFNLVRVGRHWSTSFIRYSSLLLVLHASWIAAVGVGSSNEWFAAAVPGLTALLLTLAWSAASDADAVDTLHRISSSSAVPGLPWWTALFAGWVIHKSLDNAGRAVLVSTLTSAPSSFLAFLETSVTNIFNNPTTISSYTSVLQPTINFATQTLQSLPTTTTTALPFLVTAAWIAVLAMAIARTARKTSASRIAGLAAVLCLHPSAHTHIVDAFAQIVAANPTVGDKAHQIVTNQDKEGIPTIVTMLAWGLLAAAAHKD